MSVDAFLVFPQGGINPNVPGAPVTDPYFKSMLDGYSVAELQDFSLGLKNAAVFGGGVGVGAGKVSFEPVVFHKAVDATSVPLLGHAGKGTAFPAIHLYIRKVGPTAGKPYLAYEFQTAVIVNIESSGTRNDEGVVWESLSFAYGALVIGHRQQNPDGTFGKLAKTGWSVVTNSTASQKDSKFMPD
ncbi:MAG: hypothetical protein JWQ95_5536 [Sphaerisporangium sp.]|nr:hypothetical protein [Sphaerisporangium sp.]